MKIIDALASDAEILEVARRYPGLFIPFGCIDFEGLPEQVDRMKERGFVGLKAIRPRLPYDEDDPGAVIGAHQHAPLHAGRHRRRVPRPAAHPRPHGPPPERGGRDRDRGGPHDVRHRLKETLRKAQFIESAKGAAVLLENAVRVLAGAAKGA